jgi:Ca2+-binding RTX toxin-like protein
MSANSKTRRFQFENLEARQLMAADLYIDFGAAFAWNSAQQTHLFNVSSSLSNAPTSDPSVPDQLTSLLDAMTSRGIDYDLNGSINSLDADAVAQEVAEMVSRIYEPFAINVQIVSSANVSQVNSRLAAHSSNDAYVLVGGRSADDSNLGIARLDAGNTRDNVAFAFAESILDSALDNAIDDGVHAWAYVVTALARTAAHEAAHTFGLEHLLESEEGLTSDQLKLSASDIMDVEDDNRHIFMSVFTRWDGLPTEDGTQNAFQLLADNVGLKTNGPAYVTGTGAHDVILIEGIGNNTAVVTVSAFRDGDHTDLIESQSYQINVANGVLVEGSRRDDRIEVLNLSVPVTLRGGSGDDVLIGSNGNDILEGDAGIDDLLGSAGSDTYVFRGPRFQDLNRDDINDGSGADDLLDFSELDYAVNVNLASTTNQQIEFETIPVTSSHFMNGRRYEFTLFVLPAGESRLNLNLVSGNGSTGIENVRGTRFNDRIYGNELDNELFGNSGADWLYGYNGIDMLYGGWDDDLLYGGDQRDYLYGQAGRDQLFGELGDDYLEGGYDGFADVLTGGQGADEFVQYYTWTLRSSSRIGSPVEQVYQLVEGETLADFSSSLGDKIVKRTAFLRLT